jgi:hypothetical protein
VPARRAPWFASTPRLWSSSRSPTSPRLRVHPGDLVEARLVSAGRRP